MSAAGRASSHHVVRNVTPDHESGGSTLAKENHMRFMDLELARRVERAEANAGRECAEAFHLAHPEFPVAVEEIGGGVAVFAGVDSPVTQAVGVGLGEAVPEEDLARLGDS